MIDIDQRLRTHLIVKLGHCNGMSHTRRIAVERDKNEKGIHKRILIAHFDNRLTSFMQTQDLHVSGTFTIWMILL